MQFDDLMSCCLTKVSICISTNLLSAYVTLHFYESMPSNVPDASMNFSVPLNIVPLCTSINVCSIVRVIYRSISTNLSPVVIPVYICTSMKPMHFSCLYTYALGLPYVLLCAWYTYARLRDCAFLVPMHLCSLKNLCTFKILCTFMTIHVYILWWKLYSVACLMYLCISTNLMPVECLCTYVLRWPYALFCTWFIYARPRKYAFLCIYTYALLWICTFCVPALVVCLMHMCGFVYLCSYEPRYCGATLPKCTYVPVTSYKRVPCGISDISMQLYKPVICCVPANICTYVKLCTVECLMY